MSNVQRGKKIVAATTLTTSINKNSTQKNCSNLQENIRKSTMRHPNANIERIKPKTSWIINYVDKNNIVWLNYFLY